MSQTVHVNLGERGYDIRIGRGLASVLDVSSDGLAALLISDSNVDPLYGDACSELLAERGFQVSRAVIPAGEPSKSLDCTADLYEKAVEAHLDRRAVVIALGGGVVGDLAGFVAGTYLRGVKLLQIPTSLLAMVDSSVGGKTGVNLPQGKNLVGVFYQPIEVAIDLDTLRTLPEREYFSGLAEVVKYGVIWDAAFFRYIEENADALRARAADVLEGVIARCCEIKAEVVAMDERESGVRAILNYGHTLGHAVENVCGYGELLHGEAVAIGMSYAGALSCKCRGFSEDESKRINDLLKSLELPISTEGLSDAINWGNLRSAMASDKKARRSVPTFVLAERIGSVVFNCDVPEETLEQVYQSYTL
jgi:3-dehydroquinate synthase